MIKNKKLIGPDPDIRRKPVKVATMKFTVREDRFTMVLVEHCLYFFLKHQCTVFMFFFFFQAEDGIRDVAVTWSSDVCSSDLRHQRAVHRLEAARARHRPLLDV